MAKTHDFVKVLDFGIAKVAHETSSEAETALTIPNVIHGTPAFMAPEQALGATDVDARADIYSTACVAYWLLTGQLVFRRRHADEAAAGACADTGRATLLENRDPDSTGPGCAGCFVPCQGSRRSTEVAPGPAAAPRRDCASSTVDRRPSLRMVEGASATGHYLGVIGSTASVLVPVRDTEISEPVSLRRSRR